MQNVMTKSTIWMLARSRWAMLMSLGVAMLLPSCMSDEDVRHAPVEVAETRDFELVDVRSYESGPQLTLGMTLELSSDDLRALSYLESETTGELSGIKASTEEQLHIFVRREGDPASLSVATVRWRYRNDKCVVIDTIRMNLPSGYNAETADTWYISGVLGGIYDPATKSVRFGTDRLATPIDILADGAVDVPYTFGWRRLSLTERNKGKLSGISLRPEGVLLRLHFHNDLLDAYEATSMTLTTNAWQSHGTLSPVGIANDNQQVGQSARWTPLSPSDASPRSWQYNISARGSNLELPAAMGWGTERTIFVWGMPETIAESATSTRISLAVQRAGSTTSEQIETYAKDGHRPLRAPRTYRLSNLLTAEPYISEVYYQFAPTSTHTGGEAGSTHRNYSIVEIYNPTASPVDLSNYALVRVVPSDNNAYGYFTAGVSAPVSNLREAAFLPLDVLTGSTQRLDRFPRNNNLNYRGGWYKAIYGSTTSMLEAGKTILIGAGGYVHTDLKPGANIERFNAQLGTYTAGSSTRVLELPYLPRAGMQADSAYKAKYAQAMIAIDNASNKDRDPNPLGIGGVLQLGRGQGVALVKATFGSTSGYEYTIIDTNMPLGDATAVAPYRTKLLAEANAEQGESRTTLDYMHPMSYSIVRLPHVSKGSGTYRADEWTLSASENDGLKSIGSRHYVAGLTPYARQYTGYDSRNNPVGRPFWGNRRAPEINKGGASVPTTGGNSYVFDASNVSDQRKRIQVVSARASEVHPSGSYDINLSYDGNTSTFYHSRDGGPRQAAGYPPIVLTYDLAEASYLTHIVFTPRQTSPTSSIGAYSIGVTYEDGTVATVASGNLNEPTSPTAISWAGIGDRKVRRVELTLRRNGAIAVAEMEFYGVEVPYPAHIFTDATCSELRPGVTYEMIQALSEPLYREMARKMRQGTYPREFRIADYQAYPDPKLQQQAHSTQFPYSELDNPTGISVRSGEDLVVFVGATKGNTLSLRVTDFSALGWNNYSTDRTEYPLAEGMNKIKVNRPGLVHIIYKAPMIEIDRTRYPNVRIHFADGFGQVNGYINATSNVYRGRARARLAQAVDRHFEVVGRYAHLLFPTESFRVYTNDVYELVARYDELVYSEMEFLGLVKYGGLFKNRMLLHSTNDNGYHMFAHTHRTAYHVNTMPEIASLQGLNRGPWGPAHEIGHMNQTKGFHWEGLEEVSNNVMSAYIQTAVFGNTSRLLSDNRYQRAWRTAFITERPTHAAMMDVFQKLVPFWQLELYFGNVLGQTPKRRADKGGFYPDLYQELRKGGHATSPNTHKQQAEFIYHISKVSGYNMIDFGEQWGFLKPANAVQARKSHSQTFSFTLEQSTIDDVKRRIRALPGLRTPPSTLRFITDNNYQMFASPGPVVRGSVARTGTTITLQGWRNVVTFVVVDAQDRDILYSEGKTAPGDVATLQVTTADAGSDWTSGYRLYAIAVDGTRTQVAVP